MRYYQDSLQVMQVEDFNYHLGIKQRVDDLEGEELKHFVSLRVEMLKEELAELEAAVNAEDAEETVDAVVDIVYFGIGTLLLMDVDVEAAVDEVHFANMQKKGGVKAERVNPLGLPDAIKPEGWVAPSHKNNHGRFEEIWRK